MTPIHERGMTLMEVMVALAITGVMLAAGMPYYAEYAVNAKLREGGNGLLTEAMAAQSEAIRRNTVVRLAVSGSNVQVLDMANTAVPLRQRDLGQGVEAAATNIDFSSTGALVGGLAQQVNVGMPNAECNTVKVRCPALQVAAGGGIKMCRNYKVTPC